jgi:hypothetical protein
MARNGLRTRPPGVDPRAADGDGRRIPFVSIPRHTLILLALASAQYSLPRPRNGKFAHESRSDGPRNLLELQALHPAQPSALVLYCSDFSHRQVPGSSQPNRRATHCLGEIWVSDCMLQRLHARLLPLRIRILHTLSHTEFG